MESPRVQLRPGSIWIDGKPVILFSSSLFYFRIAAEEWRDRMKTLVRLGYNTIDIYFPWNYHELEPGVWDFSGQRDVAALLRMAQEEGLWVVARPGPYICSEWDGGALPAYLSADPNLRLRDADPAYLEAVSRWFRQILPVLAGFQTGAGGSVIMMQIENELDFYDCHDRAGMMSALRDMALSAGITVPIIACSGQGDIPGATGSVEGVVPTCNVYFDERDPEIEVRVRHYARTLAVKGYPLCIVETNRSHTDLRRLILAGAKLVGPYLQTGGTDFGFTTGITNWGSPLAFMTSHYDFGGMVSPGGAIRPEGWEARLLTRMLAALGPAAALAKPVNDLPLCVEGPVVASALALDGGGWLVGLANPGTSPARVRLGEGDQRIPARVELEVEPKKCPFVLLDLPLSAWGLTGKLIYSTAELAGLERAAGTLELTFVQSGPLEIALHIPGAVLEEHPGWEVEQDDAKWRLWKNDAQPGAVTFHLAENRRLILHAVDRQSAAGFALPRGDAPQFEPVSWRAEPLNPTAQDWFAAAKACDTGRLHLEQNGVYRGYGWYRSAAPAQDTQGLLLLAGADVLSTYIGERFLGTVVPGGQNAFLPLETNDLPAPSGSLVVRAETWGHANFDDARLPALRLKSMRGMQGMAAVRQVTNLTPNWYYQDGTLQPEKSVGAAWPNLYFGGWSTTKDPAPGVYYREVHFASQADTRVLHFLDLQVNVNVYVNQELAGQATPYNPWVDLSSLALPGETSWLAIAVDRQLRLSTGQVILYEGQAIHAWELAGWGEEDFARLLAEAPADQEEVELPFQLAAGEMAWLHGRIPESASSTERLGMVFAGKELKISAWLGNRLVGRIWLPSHNRPRMAGGPDDRTYLPAGWLKEAGGKIHLLLEGTGQTEAGELSKAELVMDR